MDDLEFRRAVFADPNSTDEDLKRSAASDPVKQAFLDQMIEFDHSLADALKVEVPENLAERLILRQTLESHQQVRRRGRVHLALAASVAFAIGLSIQVLYSPFASPDIGVYSLAHVNHGIKHLYNANETNTMDQVNVKLARFGGKFDQSMGNVVFSNYCNFDGVTSLHLIYQGDDGRVSVFITPKDANFDFVEEFSDDKFIGKGLNFDRAQVTVVGDKNKSIDKFTQELEQSLNWAI
jgi:hypothetical protein